MTSGPGATTGSSGGSDMRRFIVTTVVTAVLALAVAVPVAAHGNPPPGTAKPCQPVYAPPFHFVCTPQPHPWP